MKWTTHKAVAVAGALLFEPGITAVAAAVFGSILPDMIDTLRAGGDRQRWARLHRQSSHWFGWYAILVILALPLQRILLNIGWDMAAFLPLNWIPYIASNTGTAVLWIGLGALSHIALDALNPKGVPLLPFGRRYPRAGCNLVRTGTWRESVFLACALLLIGVQFSHIRAALCMMLNLPQ